MEWGRAARSLVTVAAAVMAAATAAAEPQKVSVRFDEIDERPRPGRWQQRCGTVLTPQEVQAHLLKHTTPSDDGPPVGIPGAPYFLPIAPHIVRRDDGTGGLPVSQYESALSDANGHYASAGIVFYTMGAIDYLDSDTFFFDVDTMAEINALRTTNLVPNAINIYFTPNLAYEQGGLCGISAYTTSAVQAIAMRNNCTGTITNHSTFSHEIGHYFDLFHTHETQFGLERVNGTNCRNAGDLVCDTPADPGLANSVDGSCTYTGLEVDPNGDAYDPDPSLLMSFAPKTCRDMFTPESLERVVITLVTERPELLTSPVAVGEGFPPSRRVIALSAPRPNPTSGRTELGFAIDRPGRVRIGIYDVRGLRVRTVAYGVYSAGEHAADWDGTDERGSRSAPGIYFARMTALDEEVTRKIQIVR